MTVQDAEEYYKRYLGQGFHMGREEPGSYRAFQKLNLPDEYLIQWDKDLLEREFDRLWQEPGRVWTHHGNIITILFRGRCDREVIVSRLLDEMEKMGGLDLSCRTLIIENMAGRSANLTDGGVWLICTKTKQKPHMIKAMNELVRDKTNADANFSKADQRFSKAVQRYETALRTFGRK